MSGAIRRNVFTIAPGAPFLRTFVDALLDGEIVSTITRSTKPLDLARVTIYVPTQRAGRALAAEFARAIDKGATFLPRILPLGGLDAYENAAHFDDAADIDDTLLPQIDEIERRLLLAQLVLQWSIAVGHAIVSIDPTGARVLDESEPFLVASTPAGAYALAKELGALIDDLIIEGVTPEKIDMLADAAFDQYWSITTQFLRIALHEWPAILADRQRVDAAMRQKLLIEAQIDALSRRASGAPVIAIGSTGAQPATARLLATISTLDNGAVVLPGLDLDSSSETWARIGAIDYEPVVTHPQTLLKRLLAVMKMPRDEARELGLPSLSLRARHALASQAMAPPEATSRWRAFRAEHSASFEIALAGVTAIIAPDERMEALALALAMREALDVPERTVALVTPDRNIARRVAVELRRFDIEIDDSGGASLASTSSGALARLIASIGAEGLSAVNIAALLAHPFACFGRARADIEALTPLVEIGVLRTLILTDEWSASVTHARKLAQAKHAHPAARRNNDAQWTEIEALLRAIETAFAPCFALRGKEKLTDFAASHRAVVEAVTKGVEANSDDGAIALYDLFDRLVAADAALDIDAASYASLFDSIAFEHILRGPRRAHPRLKILGPLEARLIDADLILLAGLEEGVWPPQSDAGAFLNRSMRAAVGLPPPERRIGQSAHDFVMALGAKNVALCRAIKRDGAPTVPSRFFTRLEALSGDAFGDCIMRGKRLIAIAATLDRPQESVSISRPAPRPPVALRPKKLSVTRIERLRRDPYAIFAEYVLQLTPLAPLGAELGPREMGMAIHEAIAKFVARHPRGPLPDHAREELIKIARVELAAFQRDPFFISFIWPRVLAGLDHALAFEEERRGAATEIFVETSGVWRIPLLDRSEFALTAVADRIEIDVQGYAYVFDYKTGAPPSNSQVKSGLAPQLTLEAAMIESGAFHEIGAAPVATAAYIGLKKGGGTQWLCWKDASFSEVVADHRAQLTSMLSQYREPDTPYLSRPFVALVSGVDDFDHLARVKEWSRSGGDDA